LRYRKIKDFTALTMPFKVSKCKWGAPAGIFLLTHIYALF